MQAQTGKEPSVEDVALFLGWTSAHRSEAGRASTAVDRGTARDYSDMTRGDLLGDEVVSQGAHREVEARALPNTLVPRWLLLILASARCCSCASAWTVAKSAR
jgi:hypothetical protein